MDTQEQIPILCTRCGGQAIALDEHHTRCKYCGAFDQLPADPTLRTIQLQRRLASANAAQGKLTGTDDALAHIYEHQSSVYRVVGWTSGATLLLIFGVIGSQWNAMAYVPPAMRAEVVARTFVSTAFVWGVPLALLASLLFGRARYRRDIRNLLLARSPEQPGAPTRCRVCGGDLPETGEGLVNCRHCQTCNLVTEAVFADRTRRLEWEYATYRVRANQTIVVANQASLDMARPFKLSIALSYAAFVALSVASAHLLGH